MSVIRTESRMLSRRSMGSLGLVLIVFYLGFHAISGERGVVAWFKASRELEVLTAELTKMRTEREALEAKITLLESSSIDLDMLDEQSRKILGFAAPNEVVILNQP